MKFYTLKELYEITEKKSIENKKRMKFLKNLENEIKESSPKRLTLKQLFNDIKNLISYITNNLYKNGN